MLHRYCLTFLEDEEAGADIRSY